MRRESRSDHLSDSFTDLTTSLMVILILLPLIFVRLQIVTLFGHRRIQTGEHHIEGEN